MTELLYILLPIAIVLAAVVTLFLVFIRKPNGAGRKGAKRQSGRDRDSLVAEANRRLAQNPRDTEALNSLADLYFREEVFDKALKMYELLLGMCATDKSLNEFDLNVRFGISALKTKRYKEAYNSLLFARSMNDAVFEVNYHLGYLEYLRKNYEKAAVLLSHAREQQPEHAATAKYLGICCFRLRKYDEACAALLKALDMDPEDKETQFSLGQAYYEVNRIDNALTIFTHLRVDPEYGPSAALFAGTLHLKARKYEDAVLDFEIGMKHESVRPDVMKELKYRLAAVHIQNRNLQDGIRLLEDIYRLDPKYRDVGAQLANYRDMSRDSRLQTFLIGNTSEFVTLCRRLCSVTFPDTKVKVVDISVQRDEWADILTEVHAARWEDIVLFRFIRTTGQVGDLPLREMYARIKELKAGRGVCVAAGTFSDTARQFVEARLIDLVDRNDLEKRLRKMGSLAGN